MFCALLPDRTEGGGGKCGAAALCWPSWQRGQSKNSIQWAWHAALQRARCCMGLKPPKSRRWVEGWGAGAHAWLHAALGEGPNGGRIVLRGGSLRTFSREAVRRAATWWNKQGALLACEKERPTWTFATTRGIWEAQARRPKCALKPRGWAFPGHGRQDGHLPLGSENLAPM